VLDYWRAQGILAAAFGKNSIRLVTHLQFDDAQLEQFGQVLQKMPLAQTAG
jgi:threonine aldolase